MSNTSLEKSKLERGFRLGDFLVEPEFQRITAPDRQIQVEPRVMEVLVLMAMEPGRTVTKERFMKEVWGSTVVTEDALLRCISELRKMFADDPRQPSYIETIRKKGYRLIAPISYVADEETEPLPLPAPADQGIRWPLVWAVVSAIAVAIVVGVALLLPRLERPPLTPLRSVPLTSYPGEESDPHISPDGERVAFVWNGGRNGSLDIYVKQVGLATPIRLTESEADDFSPTWSPDGRTIAFVRQYGDRFAIYTKPALGGSERRLADMGEREIRSLAWSPDGDHLAMSIRRGPVEPFVVAEIDIETRAEVLLSDPPQDYAGDVQAVYAPDGSRIAFVRRVMEKVDDIFIVAAGGGSAQRITFDHAGISGIDWLPGGRDLVFTSDREGSSALWRVAASGSTPQWIPTSGEGTGVYQPSVARRNGRLVFVQRSIETNIWSQALGDSAGATVLISSTRLDGDPDVAADGRIAFISNRLGDFDVWVAKADGSEPVQITSLGGPFTSNPRWSPDGEHLAFVAHSEGHSDVFIIDASGGAPQRITTAGSNDRDPSWARDGASVYFGSNRTGRWEIWRRPIDGGDAQQITTRGGFAAMESPGGDTLYFVKRDVPGIWRMPLAGGEEERVVADLATFDWGNWSIVNGTLYFVSRARGAPTIMRYDLASRLTTPLSTLPGLPKTPSMAISPRADVVIYTRLDRSDSDILLVDEIP